MALAVNCQYCAMLVCALLSSFLVSEARPAMSDLIYEPTQVYNSAAGSSEPDPKAEDKSLRVLSYNIRHGAGTDERLDLERTATAIKSLTPDLVGLQEVDSSVKRSGSVNQPKELGRLLGMNAAFGSFMDYDGGQYGLAVLSRFPIKSAHALRLPEGNEPRVALIAEIAMPFGRRIALANVHFDWVEDDRFRFAQASLLAKALARLNTPYVLLGDFNDEPGSRTLKLFQGMAVEAKKPASNRLTFSSVKPEVEIDFIFASPGSKWKVGEGKAIDLPVVSDHRPVLAELVLKR